MRETVIMPPKAGSGTVPRSGSIIAVWWLQPIVVVAFAVVLVTGFISLRRGEVVGSRVRFALTLAVGVALLVVVAVALALTPRSNWW